MFKIIDMIKVTKFLVVMLVFFACFSCKKEVVNNPEAVVLDSLPDINELDDGQLLPAERSFEKEGEVVFGANAFDVVEEYTDNISLITRFSDADGRREMISHKYRNKVVHLIDKKTQDTITIKKENFKDYISEDYNEMLLQAALFGLDTKTGKVPLMINLCKADTDVCDFFVINLDEKKNLNIELFNEGDFIEE